MISAVNGRSVADIKRGLMCCDVEHSCLDALSYIGVLEYELDKLQNEFESAQPKWISVEDRLPEVGQKVMVCGLKNGMQVGAFRGLTRPDKKCNWWWKRETLLHVTHWMPIPEPPEENNDA